MAQNVPYSLRIIILLLALSEHSMNFMMPTIIVYYLESMLGFPASNEKGIRAISVKLGILESSFGICALLGGVVWGYISDKIGRKLSLQIILITAAITSIGLGLSPSFKVALFWRIISGLFGGIIPVGKSLMRDLSDDKNISILYSYFGAGYGVSSILGPLIGGFLSNPNKHLPSSLNLSVFDSFPYMLSFLGHAILVLTTFTLITIYIPDKTHSAKSEKAKSYRNLISRNYMLSVLSFFMLTYIQYTYRTLISLWLRLTEDKGGMGWSTPQEVGLMNGFSGIISMIAPLILTDKLKKRFGIRRSCILICCILMIPVSLISYLAYIEYIYIQYTLLVIFNGSSIAFFIIFISIISISISNSVNSAIAGTAIGLSQAICSFGRASSISGTAIMFGYFQSPRNLFYINDFLFLVTIVVVLEINKSVEFRNTVDSQILDEKQEELLDKTNTR